MTGRLYSYCFPSWYDVSPIFRFKLWLTSFFSACISKPEFTRCFLCFTPAVDLFEKWSVSARNAAKSAARNAARSKCGLAKLKARAIQEMQLNDDIGRNSGNISERKRIYQWVSENCCKIIVDFRCRIYFYYCCYAVIPLLQSRQEELNLKRFRNEGSNTAWMKSD